MYFKGGGGGGGGGALVLHRRALVRGGGLVPYPAGAFVGVGEGGGYVQHYLLTGCHICVGSTLSGTSGAGPVPI